MAGSLVKINEVEVSSTVSTMSLTGMNSDYDIYKVIATNIDFSANTLLTIQVIPTGGSVDSGSYYYPAVRTMRSDTTDGYKQDTAQQKYNCSSNVISDCNLEMNIHNSQNGSEYTAFDYSDVFYSSLGSNVTAGNFGAFIYAQNNTIEGLLFSSSQGTPEIVSGKFSLYGIRQ